MSQQNIEQTKLWRYKEVAEYLQLSEHTLRHFVMLRQIPFRKLGRSVRFLKSDIDQWAATKLVEATK
jgi:excisionase family DNA binding protein